MTLPNTPDFDDSPPPVEAFHIEWIVDPFTGNEVIGMVRHPRRPWRNALPKALAEMQDEHWFALGCAYLTALQTALRPATGEWIDEEILRLLLVSRASTTHGFGWLPCAWDGAPSASASQVERKPLSSFWVDRDDGKTQFMPRLLVLMAGAVDWDCQLQMGSDMGLRIVLHVHDDHVRVHGVTLSGLSTDRVVKGVPHPLPGDKQIFGLVERIRDKVGEALECGSVWIGNLEKIQPEAPVTDDGGDDAQPIKPAVPETEGERLIATGFALRWRQTRAEARARALGVRWSAPNRARTYDFRVEVSLDRSTGEVGVVQVHRDFYINSGAQDSAGPATAASTAGMGKSVALRAFVQDAASQGPAGTLSQRRSTLPDARLDVFRSDVTAVLMQDDALKFTDAGCGDLFETRGATRGGDLLGGSTVTRNPAGVVTVAPPPAAFQAPVQGAANVGPSTDANEGNEEPVLRSDAQASIDTHLRGAELFGRMLAYGIEPRTYFRFAKLPLVQRARPAMRWAPDGELPNAEVRPFMGDAEADENSRQRKPSPRDPLQLLVKYGSADPMHRRKVPYVVTEGGHGTDRGKGRFKAQYLSVACDPRWAWHEFGHVLAFAATGELELPFAHSPGDALAAIAADPMSQLATAQHPEAEIRHVTFPWIEVPGRSHGRSAARGYGWCGCRNLVRLDFSASLERYHHNYFGEQILSSSLFRLYRSLGGDTRDMNGKDREDALTRLSASDYCIYLIMRGLSLLGPDSLAPARTPDQFVSALIEADLGTADWRVSATWPFNLSARRVIRHGGRVHKVIRWAFEQQGLYATDDPKATSEELGKPPAVDVFIDDHGQRNGGYRPVPLRHGINAPEPWHAHGDWLQRTGRAVTVKVRNLGSKPAARTGLRAWWAPETAAAGDALAWTVLDVTAPSRAVVSRASTTFPVMLPPAVANAERVWVLVSVDAPADPSNLGRDDLPPASWPELLELVAHDNNLALARL
ncbi:MAG: hypothetical protein EOP35_08665 [Rubrivivax sp.]|nr:MAG: hypothetical protein EOP35_08665 [Rubrivivax sp.]